MTRFIEADKIVYDEEVIYKIRAPLTIGEDATDEFRRVADGETWRDIAFEVYGDARLYWILAELNRVTDPFEPPEPQKLLRYPTLKRIEEQVF